MSSTELNKYVLHLDSLQKKWITFTKSYKTTNTQHSSFNKANPNKKPNPSTGKFIGARVVITYIKGLSEQYRYTVANYIVRVFFKGTSTIKSLFMHQKDLIPDAQKTDIIYHWKCPANNCTAEYIQFNSIQLAFGIVPYGMPSIMEGALQLLLCQATVIHCVIPIVEGEPPPPRSTPWGAYRPTISCKAVPLSFSPCWQHSCSLTHSSQNPFSIQQTSQTFQTTRTST